MVNMFNMYLDYKKNYARIPIRIQSTIEKIIQSFIIDC